MKPEIFKYAIDNRNRIRFLYGLRETVIEPYCISRDKSGRKVIYGKPNASNEIKKYEFIKIANIRVLTENHFSAFTPVAANA
jgi:hypothetical protein